MSVPTVHVIGAGFAGAAAAVTLADAGHPVVLWEARERAGGRVNDFADPVSGEWLDNGPHLFLGGYHRTRALLSRLGSADRLTFQTALHLPQRALSGSAEMRCPSLPAPWFLLIGLLRMHGLSWAERFGLLHTGHRLKGGNIPEHGTVAEWLEAVGAPARTVTLLWEPLCRAVMNLPSSEAAATPFLNALREALLGSPNDACLGWSRVPLGDLLNDGLAGYLEARGGQLRRGRVGQVTLNKNGAVDGLTCGNEAVVADRVMIASGPFHTASLLPDAAQLSSLRDTLATMGSAPILSLYLWFDRPVIDFHGLPLQGMVGGAVEWLFDRDRLAGTDSAGGQRLAGVISAADSMMATEPEVLLTELLADLARFHPALSGVKPTHWRIVKERRATVRLTPGLVRPQAGAVDGVSGLFLCGDYTDTGLPATIEGAVRSGEAAARALRAVLIASGGRGDGPRRP